MILPVPGGIVTLSTSSKHIMCDAVWVWVCLIPRKIAVRRVPGTCKQHNLPLRVSCGIDVPRKGALPTSECDITNGPGGIGEHSLLTATT